MMPSDANQSVSDIGQQAYQRILFKEYPSAIELLNKAIRQNPGEKELYNNRSLCYFHLKDYHLALRDSKFLINNFPEYTKAYFRHAQNLFAINSYKESEQLFHEVLQRDPGCTEALMYTLELKKIKLNLSKKHNYQDKGLSHQDLVKLGRDLNIDLYYSDSELFKDDEVKFKEVTTSKKNSKKGKKN